MLIQNRAFKMQKAHKYTENSIKRELHNRNIKTQSSQHNKNTENERKNKKKQL